MINFCFPLLLLGLSMGHVVLDQNTLIDSISHSCQHDAMQEIVVVSDLKE